MMNQRQAKRVSLPKSQRGFGIISALLALIIGSIVTAGQIQGQQMETQLRAGRLQGDVLNLIKTAANDYSMENYPALQGNLPVTKNGITLPPGDVEGQAMSPSVADLVAMGYLGAGTNAQSTLGVGTYRVRLRREPVACVTIACNIPGAVYIDAPVFKPGTAEMNGVIIGAIMDRVGGDVLVSLNTSPASLLTPNGATFTNPVAGTPAGVVGARIGFGASGFGRFLIMNDPRDPNFQGNLTVFGTIHGRGAIYADTSVGVGTGATGCRLGEILASGEVVSRTAGCIRRAWIDGVNGQAGVADAAGVTRALMDGTTGQVQARDAASTTRALLNGATGEITSNDATGTARAGFTYSGAESVAYADQLRNTAGTAGILANGTVYADNMRNNANTGGVRADGTVFGTSGVFDSITINNSAVAGGACAPANSAVWGFVGAAPTLLKCDGGIWKSANGLVTAINGGACATENQQGITTTGVGLLCSGGTWMLATDRMGKFVVTFAGVGTNTSITSKPACGGGGTPKIYMIPRSVDASTLFINYTATDLGGAWQLNITDGVGAGVPGTVLYQSGCFY